MTLAAPRSFAHQRAGHCGSGAIRDLLEFHGLDHGHGPVSEELVFGLSGALGFLYLDAVPAPAPPVYLVGRTADLERDIAPQLGATLDIRRTDDPALGWAWVRDEVDAGRPPMIWADIGHLEYLRVRMHNTRHDIVVVDHDEAAGIAWIADNDRDELQPCSLESLARARRSDAFPGPAEHTTFVYGWPTALPPLGPAVRAAAAIAVANMRGAGPPLAGLPGRTGLEGIAALADDYGRWPQRFGDQLPEALRALWAFIVKAGTGGAMFRSLQAGFLEQAGEQLTDPTVAAASRRYRQLAEAWAALAVAAEADDHAAGVDPLAAVARLEVEALDGLEACA
ncbi:BtrH N-terminal domain-containing protein [Patulibacter defluvii]|uniref:BtrH N-terminal domain-containing protein n=1 Tax=Patulibacter defluvii TaxID=3095358 RepID=UPI002A75F817|nr:BtrH N-terminal domain-containing protein [Patulibacter sp. DM4]